MYLEIVNSRVLDIVGIWSRLVRTFLVDSDWSFLAFVKQWERSQCLRRSVSSHWLFWRLRIWRIFAQNGTNWRLSRARLHCTSWWDHRLEYFWVILDLSSAILTSETQSLHCAGVRSVVSFSLYSSTLKCIQNYHPEITAHLPIWQ